MKTNRTLSVAVVAVAVGGVLPLVVAAPATAAATPIVVTGGDLSADGSSGWAVESLRGGTGAFVQGTGTPPLGTGSYRLASNATGDKQFLHLTAVEGQPFLGMPLTDLTGLSYSSYATDASYSPYVNIPVHSYFIDADGNNVADGDQGFVPPATGNAVLVYEPVVPANAWGTNDTMVTSQWRLTRKVVDGAVTPLWTYKTYAGWTALLSDGVVNPLYGDIQFVVGDTSTPAWGGRQGWVDAISVTTVDADVTYDLEEGLGSCPVDIDVPGQTFTLTDDCTTRATLVLRDGWTLDGAGYTVTALDPAPVWPATTSADFTGAVLTNEVVPGGAEMHVRDVDIVGDFGDGCSSSLFGVRFDGAAGSLDDVDVAGIRYGAGSGCQSGNSVDITNLGGPTRLSVVASGIDVTDFQKTGIRANGNVALRLTGSSVESSGLDMVTASNSLQLSRGARAYIAGNTFGGNDWDGNDQWSATGVLLYGAEDVTFVRNVVEGTDTDVAFYVSQDDTYQAGRTTVTCNLFERDEAADTEPVGALDLWNTGVVADEDLTARVDATGNTVRGFATDYENVVDEVGGPCLPNPVTDLVLGGSGTTATAAWSAPAPLPYAPVTAYDVTLLPSGQTQRVTAPTADFAVTPGQQLTVTVTAVNAAGSGPSRSASFDTSLPTAPTDLNAVGGRTSLSLSWTAPNPASPVTGYDVTATPVTGSPVSVTVPAAGLTFPYTIEGLTEGTAYTVSVRATNAFGTGPAASVTLRGTTATATISSARVVIGSRVTVTGVVEDAGTGAPVAGATVHLWGKPKATATWSDRGARATTLSDGTYRFSFRPKATGRWSVEVTGDGRMAAASVRSRVVVVGKASFHLDDATVRAGTVVTGSGTVRPKSATLVELQRRTSNGWVTKQVTTPVAGAYTLSFTARTDARWRVRVSGPSFAAATSPVRTVSVR